MPKPVPVQPIEHLLNEHPFLQGVDSKHIHSLAACAQNRTFQAGEYLWRQGEQADVLYLIRSGEVNLEISIPGEGPLPLETIVAGEVLGWSWLVPPYRWHFDARATTPVRALALEGKCVREKCEQDTELGYQVLKRFTPVIARRLEVTRARLIESTGHSPGNSRPVPVLC